MNFFLLLVLGLHLTKLNHLPNLILLNIQIIYLLIFSHILLQKSIKQKLTTMSIDEDTFHETYIKIEDIIELFVFELVLTNGTYYLLRSCKFQSNLEYILGLKRGAFITSNRTQSSFSQQHWQLGVFGLNHTIFIYTGSQLLMKFTNLLSPLKQSDRFKQLLYPLLHLTKGFLINIRVFLLGESQMPIFTVHTCKIESIHILLFLFVHTFLEFRQYKPTLTEVVLIEVVRTIGEGTSDLFWRYQKVMINMFKAKEKETVGVGSRGAVPMDQGVTDSYLTRVANQIDQNRQRTLQILMLILLNFFLSESLHFSSDSLDIQMIEAVIFDQLPQFDLHHCRLLFQHSYQLIKQC